MHQIEQRGHVYTVANHKSSTENAPDAKTGDSALSPRYARNTSESEPDRWCQRRGRSWWCCGRAGRSSRSTGCRRGRSWWPSARRVSAEPRSGEHDSMTSSPIRRSEPPAARGAPYDSRSRVMSSASARTMDHFAEVCRAFTVQARHCEAAHAPEHRAVAWRRALLTVEIPGPSTRAHQILTGSEFARSRQSGPVRESL